MNTLTADAPLQSAPFKFTSPSSANAVKVIPRRRLWGKVAAGIAVVAVLGLGMVKYERYAAGFESTDDSFLEGDLHPISPRINGTVLRVLVQDNAHVKSGQPLAIIDPADLNLAVEGAEAELAQARANAFQVAAQITRAEADVEASIARLAQNAAVLNREEIDFKRAESLVREGTGAISKQAFDSARAAFDVAGAKQNSLKAERASSEALLLAAHAQEAVAKAQIQKAESALRMAQLQVEYTIVRAPTAGRIAKKTVEVGQRLVAGQPMMGVVSDEIWVVANFKESQLAHMKAGQKVAVKVDAIDHHTFLGVIDSFSPGTGAKFSLLPPDNSTGNFTKVVQRVPVKIVLDNASVGDAASRLSPGLSTLVKVSLAH